MLQLLLTKVISLQDSKASLPWTLAHSFGFGFVAHLHLIEEHSVGSLVDETYSRYLSLLISAVQKIGKFASAQVAIASFDSMMLVVIVYVPKVLSLPSK